MLSILAALAMLAASDGWEIGSQEDKTIPACPDGWEIGSTDGWEIGDQCVDPDGYTWTYDGYTWTKTGTDGYTW